MSPKVAYPLWATNFPLLTQPTTLTRIVQFPDGYNSFNKLPVSYKCPDFNLSYFIERLKPCFDENCSMDEDGDDDCFLEGNRDNSTVLVNANENKLTEKLIKGGKSCLFNLRTVTQLILL